MKKITFYFILAISVFSFFIVSCSSADKNEYKEESAVYDNVSANESTSGTKESNEIDVETVITEQRKLIKTGDIMFETVSLEETRTIIDKAVTKHKAYISNEQSQTQTDRIVNTLVIRVNTENFDKLLGEICTGVEFFDKRVIDVNDVTEEYLDIQARLKTKKELENRYLELLKKANKVSEILEIEKQISYLRTEIESIEGRLNYLKNRIEFSTLTLTYYVKTKNYKTTYSEKFSDGFSNGVKALIWFFIILVNLWPFLLITAFVLWYIRWRIKKKKQKQS